ncbi:MAG: hypothetical protein E7214_01215 [Clostridium sp.]|nr:hypothetical protein [Clostridium sp.]
MNDTKIDTFQTNELLYKEGEVLIKFQKNASNSEKVSTINSIDNTIKLESVEDDFLLINIPSNITVEDVINNYSYNPSIEFIQPNYMYKLDALDLEATVNDPVEQYHLQKIGAYSAWDHFRNSSASSITVAVLDTGVDTTHPDLKNNIKIAKDATNNFQNITTDLSNHGTHVCGIISAVCNNGIGVAGITYNKVSLMCIRVFKYNNSSLVAFSSDILNGYKYAVENGARIINMSLGFLGEKGYYDKLLETAINDAARKGVVTVCSAGNENSSTPHYPSDFDACISVMATDINDKRANYSNYGDAKDISAPGTNIYSTLPNGKYGSMSGTSMASPIVAAVAALMLAKNPNLTVDQVKSILYNTAVDLGTKGKDIYYGYGRVNAQAALNSIDPFINGKVSYQCHLHNIGWQGNRIDGNTAGIYNGNLNIECIKISLINAPKGANIKYQSHVQNIGWMSTVSNGQESGTTGRNYGIEAIKINLENYPGYSVQYRVCIKGKGWQDWVFDGQIAGTTGQSLQIEAIQIVITPKASKVNYQAHIQNIGWQYWVSDAQTAGTTGQSKRMEAIKINLKDAPKNSKVNYQTHIQNLGWRPWVSNGQVSGTIEKSLSIEAIRITLTNYNGYQIYYRTHVQNIGWQDWVSNGQISGTVGKSLRMEAIEIKIVKE